MNLDFVYSYLGTTDATLTYRLFGASDSSLVGWLNSILYFVLVYRCFLKLKDRRLAYDLRGIWLGLLGLFLMLGLNKQLDFHVYAIRALKNAVINAGWWQYRQELKILLLVIGLTFATAFLWFTRHAVVKVYRENKTLWVGGALLAFYVFLRYATFNNFITGTPHFLAEYFSALTEFVALCVLLVATFKKPLFDSAS